MCIHEFHNKVALNNNNINNNNNVCFSFLLLWDAGVEQFGKKKS